QLEFGGSKLDVGSQQVSFRIASALEVSSSEVFKLEYGDTSTLSTLTAAQLERRTVLTEIPDFQREHASRWQESATKQQGFLRKLVELKAALVISVDRQSQIGSGVGNGWLIDPEAPDAQIASPPPWLRVHSSEVVKAYDSLKPGINRGTVLLSIPA